MSLMVIWFLLQLRLHTLLINHDLSSSNYLRWQNNSARWSREVGTFNNVPIVYTSPSQLDEELHSTAQCIGETFHDNSWVYRSCAYTNFCYDTEEKGFALFRSASQKALDDELIHISNLFTISSGLNTTVSLGAINPKWSKEDIASLEWAPTVREQKDLMKEGYYALPRGTVLIPFHR